MQIRYIITLLIIICGCKIDDRSEPLNSFTISEKQIEYFSNKVDSIFNNSQYLLTKKDITLIKREFGAPNLLLEESERKRIFSVVLDEKQLIDVEIDIRSSKGFIFNLRGFSTYFRHWSKEVNLSTIHKSYSNIKAYHINQLVVDKKWLVNTDNLEGYLKNERINNVLLIEKEVLTSDGIITVSMYIKMDDQENKTSKKLNI
jgi:hypothetical protein